MAKAVAKMKAQDIHFFSGHKGGIGKSHCAGLLKQYMQSRSIPARVIDLDPSNSSLASYKALEADQMSVVDEEGKFSDPLMDELMDFLETETSNFIVDFGASAMFGVWDYMQRLDSQDRLVSNNRRLLMHVIVTGGGEMKDTLNSLDEVCKASHGRSVVVWENTRFGRATFEGKHFVDLGVYQRNQDKILATMLLPVPDSTTGEYLKQLAQRSITLDQAIEDKESWTSSQRHRFVVYRRNLFAQMDAAWSLIGQEQISVDVATAV